MPSPTVKLATRTYAEMALKAVQIPLPQGQRIVTSELVEHGKPHPDPYTLGAKICRAEPTECTVFRSSGLFIVVHIPNRPSCRRRALGNNQWPEGRVQDAGSLYKS